MRGGDSLTSEKLDAAERVVHDAVAGTACHDELPRVVNVVWADVTRLVKVE